MCASDADAEAGGGRGRKPLTWNNIHNWGMGIKEVEKAC